MIGEREPIFVQQWKDRMKTIIRYRFKDHPLSEKKIDNYLNKVLAKSMKNPKVKVVNNYRNKEVDTDLLALIDTIHDNDLIIGGGGVLYVQHDTNGRDNVMYDYISEKQKLRGDYKKRRKQYEKGTNEWMYYDILQNATKIIINSLYGVHGYEGFILYNRFIAESITNIGRQIITTAVMTFENFLSSGVKYNTEEEVYQYFINVTNGYDSKIDYTVFEIDDIDTKVMKRLVDCCAFHPSDKFLYSLREMVNGLSYGEKVLLYYKNNLYDFSRVPFIFEKLKYIMINTKELKSPERDQLEDNQPEILQLIDEVWDFYKEFVFYDFPIYDRVRKAMFTDRNSVLYVDTDSNFLGLNKWVRFIKDEVLENRYNKDETEIDFIAINIMAMILSEVIDGGLQSLCKHMGTHEGPASRLNMKNEFYLSRIIFTEGTKKRYVSNSVLQEGQLLNKGKGDPSITGFDFKKAGTKPYLRDLYTHICEDMILRADYIDVEEIYLTVMKLQKEIEESLKAGESRFFKQATVQIVDHYTNPYSTQGVVSVLLWNALCPEYAMDLPTDCDICPIHELTGPSFDKARNKMVWKNEDFCMEFKERFPEAYARLEKEIYGNPNDLIRHMKLTSIAKPKNEEIPIPEWFRFLVDYDEVVRADIKLIAPILNSLGLKSLKTNASTEYITNIVDL